MIEKLYWKVRRFSIWSLFCVRKKDIPKLLEALEDLKRSMMLCGHPDYVREISAIMDEMERQKEKRMAMKLTPLKKQSKSRQREYYASRRGSWNGVSPVTRIVPSRKAYDRNRMKREDIQNAGKNESR